tara:strand:- start:21 stop:554 length:534 start_codon:yes stop_codon:yes gene_type:complete
MSDITNPTTVKRLIPIGVELFTTMLLDIGKFHADPHIGNLLVNPQNELILLDFGLCCDISLQERNDITVAMKNLLMGNYEGEYLKRLCDGVTADSVEKKSIVLSCGRLVVRLFLPFFSFQHWRGHAPLVWIVPRSTPSHEKMPLAELATVSNYECLKRPYVGVTVDPVIAMVKKLTQ